MSFNLVPAGKKIPEEFNVVIEIPMLGPPVKYEVNKKSGVLFVDRFLSTAMHYPCNYGYVPQTLAEDGDPVDVLVITPVPLLSGSVVPVRPVGVLQMSDEAGEDVKILAVPIPKLCSLYDHILSYSDLPQNVTQSISHFFEHYKDLEPGKWVKVRGWADANEGKRLIQEGVDRFHHEKKNTGSSITA
jgi:inorganic pyrophosphatase